MNYNRSRFGVVIVGDELLSGKRRDGHLNFISDTLSRLGGQLEWVRIVADDIPLQAQTYRETRANGATVFSFGGIGATPDDLTRQAAARAFERPLIEHPQGIKLLKNRFKQDLSPRRRQLVHFPQGASLIPNPVNQVPGFSLLNHYFVPGFPSMAWPMVEQVLQTDFAEALKQTADIELLIHTRGVYEGTLIPLIEAVLSRHPDLKIACLPKSDFSKRVELGVKGTPQKVKTGFDQLCVLLDKASIEYTTQDAGGTQYKSPGDCTS